VAPEPFGREELRLFFSNLSDLEIKARKEA
jgi:hypothetical protein